MRQVIKVFFLGASTLYKAIVAYDSDIPFFSTPYISALVVIFEYVWVTRTLSDLCGTKYYALMQSWFCERLQNYWSPNKAIIDLRYNGIVACPKSCVCFWVKPLFCKLVGAWQVFDRAHGPPKVSLSKLKRGNRTWSHTKCGFTADMAWCLWHD